MNIRSKFQIYLYFRYIVCIFLASTTLPQTLLSVSLKNRPLEYFNFFQTERGTDVDLFGKYSNVVTTFRWFGSTVKHKTLVVFISRILLLLERSYVNNVDTEITGDKTLSSELLNYELCLCEDRYVSIFENQKARKVNFKLSFNQTLPLKQLGMLYWPSAF